MEHLSALLAIDCFLNLLYNDGNRDDNHDDDSGDYNQVIIVVVFLLMTVIVIIRSCLYTVQRVIFPTCVQN